MSVTLPLNLLKKFPSDCQLKYIFPFVCLFQLTFYHFDFSSKLFTLFRRSRVLDGSSRKRLAGTCKALKESEKQSWARICKRLRNPGIDSKESFRQPMYPGVPYVKWGYRTSPPGWESIPGLLKRFKDTGSGILEQYMVG
jgi:hypothetical protein